MTKNKELYILIADKKWYEIVAHYSPSSIVYALSFCECIKLALELLDEELWDFDLHVYAAKLLEVVRHHYPRDWNSSWKYDVFLGQICNLVLDYDGRYEAFLRAYEKSKTQPAPQLLIELAGCYRCPGKSPLSYGQVVAYLQLALKDHLYRDGIGAMRGAWYLIKDKKKSAYWGYLYHLLWHIGINSPQIDPECLEQYVTFQKNTGAERQHKKLQELFSRKTILELIQESSFQTGLRLAYEFLFNPDWERKMQEYSVALLEALRHKYPREWNASWRNDGFLSTAYLLTLKSKKRYETLKRACEQVKTPPPELLIALASCSLYDDAELLLSDQEMAPSVSTESFAIPSYEQAIEYLKFAMKDHLYTDGLWLLFTIYELNNDQENRTYWGNVYHMLGKDWDFSIPLAPEL